MTRLRRGRTKGTQGDDAPRGQDERRLDTLLDPALRGLGVAGKVHELQLQSIFAEVVGPALAPMCSAISLDRGRLVISTTHSALAHQLQMEGPDLIAALNARIGSPAVKRLAFAPQARR